MSGRTSGDQWPRFESLGADAAEVFAVLSRAVSGGRAPGRRCVRLGDPPVIEVGFSNTGNPFVRRAGGAAEPDWSTLVAAVQAGLVSEDMWATFAMSGRFRSSGSIATRCLQVRPVEDLLLGPTAFLFEQDAASDVGIPLNAVLVDVLYERTADPFLGAQRRQLAVDEAANLLCVAAWPKVWRPDGQLIDWALTGGSEPGEIRNIPTVHAFHHLGLGDQPDRPAIDASRPMATLEHSRVTAGPLDHLDGRLYMPNSLASLDQALRTMARLERNQARRALAFYADASRTQNPSAAIPSYVAAIEALLTPTNPVTCTECGQSGFAVSRQVKAFLDTYAGKELRREFRNAIYNLRSRLAHGAWHYAVDAAPFSVIDDRHLDELKVQTAVHAALLNWLLSRADSTRETALNS